MSTNEVPPSPMSSSRISLPLGLRSRRASIASISAVSQADKEQLAQVLDAIHNTASQSDSLTTFNEFAPPPPASTSLEAKSLTGELMNHGFSGLYNRFKEVVAGTKDRQGESESAKSPERSPHGSKHGNELAHPAINTLAANEVKHSAVPSPLQLSHPPSPTATRSETSIQTAEHASQHSKNTTTDTPSSRKPLIASRPLLPSIAKTGSSTAVVAAAPVTVSAFRNGDRAESASIDSGHTREPFNRERSAHDTPSMMSPTMTALAPTGDRASIAFSDITGSDIDQHDGPRGDGSSSRRDSLSLPQRDLSARSLLRPYDRFSQPSSSIYRSSRASSTDRSAAEASHITTSAHHTVHHDFLPSDDGRADRFINSNRIPGTTLNQGNPGAVSARLEAMRKQVLSKEFWMADEICRECFACGITFTAFRRKHHCRTCGCIFDSKCTSIIPGEKFGVQGTLRVCKNCLDIINRRHEWSDSDDSGDDLPLPTSFFQSQQAKREAAANNGLSIKIDLPEFTGRGTGNDSEPIATPMMAIPATRRVGDSANRRSAVLEIEAPQLSRPGSSRSLKGITSATRPVSSSQRATQLKNNILGRFKSITDDRPPFRGDSNAGQLNTHNRLPTFHDDNIIDPDLAPYMSDDESSGDEQMSIFAALNGDTVMGSSVDHDRMAMSSLLSGPRKHRRGGDKSVGGISFHGRPDDGASLSGSLVLNRPSRRRNLSTSSATFHLPRNSPRPKTASRMHGFGDLSEETSMDSPFEPAQTGRGAMAMIRSASMRDARAPAVELNQASLHHVRRLLRQLLEDANVPKVASWEKALMPILLQCTDDVNPDVRRGDDIDIRHYVKLKKIPGGKPGDTSYVSGVVFTKNLALKSMSRSIPHPRVVIVSFPIEYQRHHQHFMSLGPVIAQEKDFLRNMVNRIASLRPHVVLVQSHISGLALQYLAEAGIAVAYNVKASVIEAVSRFAQTEVISSIDMVALKPVHVGKAMGFDVKTYVHDDIPGRKKTCIYISGCPKDLGCTIVLRGASMPVLTKMKRITEFMVYVVYNLKLETCLMRDEFVLIPSIPDEELKEASQKAVREHRVTSEQAPTSDSAVVLCPSIAPVEVETKTDGNVNATNGQVSDDEPPTQTVDSVPSEAIQTPSTEPPAEHKLVSVHESHAHKHDDGDVPEDIVPTFYSDMVAKHQTKILSASPFVKFAQPYLLMNAREQERRLVYLKRLRDQDTYEEQTGSENEKPQKFQLIQPEMVHETVKGAPKAIMQVLHAVHDAEYDKALHNYLTHKRQWENYIQGNLNLFDPYGHQNIVVLYSVVCTATTVPCMGPDLMAMSFYNEHETTRDFFPDCTLGQYVEDICLSVDQICSANGCEKKMSEHHRTYVHGGARITVFVENAPCKLSGLQDSILMWSYCKICKNETQVMPMSESTWKYSFGKYLELSFWSTELRLRAGVCPHDLHRDHLRYFGFRNVTMRIHYDPVDLLDIVVPRARITWKVDNDLRLKNDLYLKTESKWNIFMASVKSRIGGINIDSVISEKAEACKAEIARLTQRAQDEHVEMLRKLQTKYMESRYYEVIPMNRAIRAMQEKVADWDSAFADLDANFFPSEKDIRRLAALQLKNLFLDRDSSVTSLVSNEASEQPSEQPSEVDEKSEVRKVEDEIADDNTPIAEENKQLELIDEEPTPIANMVETPLSILDQHTPADANQEGLQHLDLAVPLPPSTDAGLALGPMTDGSPESVVDRAQDAAAGQQNILLHPPPERSESEVSLSDKIQQLRKASLMVSPDIPSTFESSIPRPIQTGERSSGRKAGQTVSPPILRTQSQPATTIRKLQKAQPAAKNKDLINSAPLPNDSSLSIPSSSTSDLVKDKKLSERLGLGTLKNGRKAGASLIPRSIQGKKKDSKVSTLAKHFEQLSREFEKERMRDRKQRAAKASRSQAFPRASSKPIVEVYKDVNEAVEERGPSDDALRNVYPSQSSSDITTSIEGLAQVNSDNIEVDTAPPPSTDAGEETATEAETDHHNHDASQTATDDEGMVTDAEQSLGDLPDAAEIADSLGTSEIGTDTELPKHERSSLMKMLSTFWAERSASGWTQLEYPLQSTEHVFADSDVIVREDEPSSLIAFALASKDYTEKLEHIRNQGRMKEPSAGASQPPSLSETDVETSLLRATGTHLKYQFAIGSCKMLCKIFYAEQFDAVRRKCGAADRIIESLSRCLKWDSKGGKTKSVFLKTLDDRLVMKGLSPIETQAFLNFAPAYFGLMAEALFHELPSVIAKMLGFYQIVIKNPATGTEIKLDLLVMENLFYDRVPTRIFDLKGSMRNRKIHSTGEQNEVLLDENMVEFIYESPLFVREHSKKLLKASVWNDTLFLARQNVMDYSLMVAVDEKRKELVVGIIDCIRTYTWDKKLESWIKDRGFGGGGRNRPTVTSPKEYKSRFRLAMDRYVLQAPNCWHHFGPADRLLKPPQ